MNPIAQKALDRAMGKILPIPQPKPLVARTFADVMVQLDVNEIDTSGPIDRVTYLEGRGVALDIVRCAGSTITDPTQVAKLVQTLIRAAVSRPPSYALGIKDVIGMLGVKS